MDEWRPKGPHAGERLTREDVLRLIEEHGGPEGLHLRRADLRQADLSQLDLHGADLSWANLQGAHLVVAKLQGANLLEAHLGRANLSGANLQGANLWAADLQGADLVEADLQGANLPDANLQEADLRGTNLQGAYLASANLQGAYFTEANLHGADLSQANLQGAYLASADPQGPRLWGAELEGADLRWADLRRAHLAGASLRDANLEGANWGDYVLGDEIDGYLGRAASGYRALKQWHTEAGMYDIAGEFHYRELEARRKLAWKGNLARGEKRRLPYAVTLYALRFLYGYGERPERVIGWVVAVMLGFALGHWLFGTVAGGFLDALYYSAVSFTALGYGGWVDQSPSWAGKFLGVGESLLGVFMMALFLVTFTRKMTR